MHRRHEHELPAELVIRQGGLPTIRLDTTLVDCWGHCEDGVRRAPVIESVRRGLITADAVRRVTLGTPRLRGRAELLRLIDLLKRGCQSELEIFGYTKVFNHRSLPAAAWQWAVVVAGRRFFLDLAWPDLLLAVELDGAAYHGGRAQRERDVGRDAALAAAGWLVIRVTHARLTGDPAGVRAEIREIIRVRREQLAAVGRD